MRLARNHLLWIWVCLGLAGSIAIAASRSDLVVYAGIAALCGAWLALGRVKGLETSQLLMIGAVWVVPLVIGPVLFSRDMYSYLAQGSILHHGLDPYHQAPVVLGRLHEPRLLAQVGPFWRHTTAPYGPLFLGIASVISGVAGANLVAGVLLLRVVELAGVILLAVFVPRLARRLGSDPARATWLAVISPLVLLELIAAGHNDALMAGLLVAGVTLALERRPLLGIGLCAMAATIKLPAAAGVVFILICWLRAEPRNATTIVLGAAAVVAAVLGAVTVITGLSLDWIPAALSTPEKARIAITPATAVGHSLAPLLQALGVEVSSRSVENGAHLVTFALTAAVALALCRRVRYENLVWCLGLTLIALALGGPAAWPWYLSWGVALIACCQLVQRWRWLPVALAASVFLIRADGQLVVFRGAAPVVLAVYVLAAALLWRRFSPPAPPRPQFAR